MKEVKRLGKWYSKQKFGGKLVFGCLGFLLLCCLCSVPATFFTPETPAPISSNATSIPLENIIQSTSDAASSQTATSYSATPIVTQTATETVVPTVIPSVVVSTEIFPTLVIVPIPVSGNPLKFYFINVGQGDATLIIAPDGKTVLIDGGDTNTGIVTQLQNIGIQRVDLMIATHPHSDHIGGLVQVLQSFPVGKVVTSGQMHTTSVYESFLDSIGAARAEIVSVKQGDVISVGGIDFRVLNPVSNSNSDLNENSVVLQFAYGGTTFLMMGDSGADTEAALLSAGVPLKADILKVGHHASKSGSTIAFLNAVQPKIALYSAGINNQYGHPVSQTIDALSGVGATIYGTDKNGLININVELNGYTVNAAQNSVFVPPVLATPDLVVGGLEIVSVTSPVSKGGYATLSAKTAPGASCSITVLYKSGPSSAAGLETKIADGSGMVSWGWKVGARTTSGTWKIVVSCSGTTKETSFMVQ